MAARVIRGPDANPGFSGRIALTYDGTLTGDDQNEIWAHTGCRATVRPRKKIRYLWVYSKDGSEDGLDEAIKMALSKIKASAINRVKRDNRGRLKRTIKTALKPLAPPPPPPHPHGFMMMPHGHLQPMPMMMPHMHMMMMGHHPMLGMPQQPMPAMPMMMPQQPMPAMPRSHSRTASSSWL